MAWRVLFRSLQSRQILRCVRVAYSDAGSPEAALLRRYAEVAWGLSKGNVAKTRGYIHVAYQLQEKMVHEEWSLGTVPIGFADLKVYATTSDGSSSRLYLAGFDENLTLFDVYRRAATPATVAVDVGANIGVHSLVLSRCVGKQGSVYSYEPSTALHGKFLKNMELNEVSNVTLREVGAGAANSVMRFQPSEGEFNVGLGRFESQGPKEVKVVTLDSELPLLGKVSLIKIDVEGMELDVIRGARRMLREQHPALVLECNPQWTLQELRDQIPYPVTISSIPLTLLDRAQNLDGVLRYDDSRNILVRPAG
jgi:FkbM family methyltransferase